MRTGELPRATLEGSALWTRSEVSWTALWTTVKDRLAALDTRTTGDWRRSSRDRRRRWGLIHRARTRLWHNDLAHLRSRGGRRGRRRFDSQCGRYGSRDRRRLGSHDRSGAVAGRSCRSDRCRYGLRGCSSGLGRNLGGSSGSGSLSNSDGRADSLGRFRRTYRGHRGRRSRLGRGGGLRWLTYDDHGRCRWSCSHQRGRRCHRRFHHHRSSGRSDHDGRTRRRRDGSRGSRRTSNHRPRRRTRANCWAGCRWRRLHNRRSLPGLRHDSARLRPRSDWRRNCRCSRDASRRNCCRARRICSGYTRSSGRECSRPTTRWRTHHHRRRSAWALGKLRLPFHFLLACQDGLQRIAWFRDMREIDFGARLALMA